MADSAEADSTGKLAIRSNFRPRIHDQEQERLSMSFKAVSREVGGVTVIDMDGRITLGEGSDLLRELIEGNSFRPKKMT